MATIILADNKIKKPYRSKENILTIHSPKTYCIDTADTESIDSKIMIELTKNTTVHVTTKFNRQKIQTINGPNKQRIWVMLLNEPYFDKHQIKKGDLIGYLVFEPNNIQIKYEKNRPAKTRRPPNNYLPKKLSKNWKEYWQKKKETNRRNFE